jgi:hypothetical protein
MTIEQYLRLKGRRAYIMLCLEWANGEYACDLTYELQGIDRILANFEPVTRREAYDEGAYTFTPPYVTYGWTDDDWMRYVTYTVPVKD